MADTLENKIELEPVKKPRVFPKKLFIGLGMLLLVIAFLVVFVALPLLEIKSEILDLNEEVKGISAGIQAQNLNQAIEKLGTTKNRLNNLATSYKKLGWVRFIPIASGFYKDGERLIRGGNYLLEAGEIAVEELKPYADLLGLEGKEEKEDTKNLTAEERLMLALDTLDKLGPSLDRIGEKLEQARKEIDQINPSRYPEQIFGKKIREKIVVLVKMIDSTAEMATEIKPIIGYLKPLLGFPEEKRYLLIFQNDAELRPTGGFLTAYAVLSVNKGNFKPLGSYDIYSLDAKFGNRLPPPEPIKKYHKNVYYWHLRDMNLSPDFKVFMDNFWPNYKKAGGPDVNGVVAVDTKVLVDLLRVLGSVGVADWGKFSAENDPRCNCPQVFYELERQITKPVGILKTERKAVLGPLMHSILLNVMQSPRKKWPEFFNLASANIQEKHMLFYFFDEELQKAIEVLNAGGRIKEYDGDYLHINDCNFAGAKSNIFVDEFIKQEIEVQNDGTIIKKVTIEYKNPYPHSDCNLEKGELCLNALLRNWLRFYVPKGSELLEFSGSEMETKSYEELGKEVFEGFMTVRPLGKGMVSVKYKLPFKFSKGEEYKLFIQKQPGAKSHFYEIFLNGQKLEEFNLQTDREIKFKI